jgi:hypothetical protein
VAHFYDLDALCEHAMRLLHKHVSATRCFVVVETAEGQGTVLAATDEATPGVVTASKGTPPMQRRANGFADG